MGIAGDQNRRPSSGGGRRNGQAVGSRKISRKDREFQENMLGIFEVYFASLLRLHYPGSGRAGKTLHHRFSASEASLAAISFSRLPKN